MKEFLEKVSLAAGRLVGRGEHAKQRVVDDVEVRAAQLKSDAQSMLDQGKRQGAHLKATFVEARQQALTEARRLRAAPARSRRVDP